MDNRKKTREKTNFLKEAISALLEKGRCQFGGYYLWRDQSVLHVNLIDRHAGSGKKLLPDSLAEHVQFHSVPYSLEELSAFHSAATGYLFDKHDLGVRMTDVDVMHNCVTIGVDDCSPQRIEKVARELAGHGFADRRMYRIIGCDKIGSGGEDEDTPASALSAAQPLSSSTPVEVMPGGWLGRLNSSGSLAGVASLTGAAYYNGNLYLMTAGHGGASVGETIVYAEPPTSGIYPMNGTDLSAYAPNGRVEVGTIAMVRYGGYYDFSSIRVTNPNVTVNGRAYNGMLPELFGGTPQVGQIVRFTGVSSKHAGPLEYGYCRSVQATYKDVRGVTLNDVITVDLGGNGGTSGGPLFMNDILNDDKVNLIGSGSSTVNGTTVFVKYSRVMNDYNLTPYFPDLGGGGA